jgi:peptidyl-prolyl cis-trans isomerase B (cyclophilin B)
MRRLSALIAVAALSALSASARAEDSKGPKRSWSFSKKGHEPVVIMDTSKGKIYIRFFNDKAPEHVLNFLIHSERNFFKGTAFHRVDPSRGIEGGDPNTLDDDPANDGAGGHSYKGPGTFLPLEKNDLRHVRGAVSSVPCGKEYKGGSRFMIIAEDLEGLAGRCTVFGRVIKGLKVLDKIAGEPGAPLKPWGARPKKPVVVRKVSIKMWPTRQIEKTAKREYSQERHPVALLETTQGKILVRFYPKKAPEHVKNFIHHARKKYYDGTYFHRVIPGFMIQGGDPNTKDGDPSNDGAGGYSYKGSNTYLKAEFNDISHKRGILSMARSRSPDSAGSQFFIMVADNAGLDGKYTVFGRVLSGMKAVDRIVSQKGDSLDAGGVNPHVHQYLKKVTISYVTGAELRKMEKR